MSNELKPLHFDADYTMEEALAEAKRCLNCPKPLCALRPVIPINACTLRITAAAGTELAGASSVVNVNHLVY